MSHHWTELWRFLNPFHPILTFFAGTGAVAFRKYRQKKRENSAAMWPRAEAVVQVAALKPRSGGYWVEVSYRYYALQEYRYGKYERHFRKKAKAEAFAEAMRGRSLQIRYREDSPDTSVLMERDLEMAGALQLQ
jgi:hypothetical protein